MKPPTLMIDLDGLLVFTFYPEPPTFTEIDSTR
jgi:hypothetical protein